MKRFLTAAAIVSALFSANGAQAAIVSDPGFETPVIATNSYSFNTAGAPWTFSGRSGIVNGNGGGFGTTGQDGAQAAFLQNLNGFPIGSFSETVTLAAGLYNLSFLEENRSNSGQASFTVTLGGLNIGGDSAGTGSFTPYSNTFNTSGGTLVLTFTASVGTTGDTTTFIDDVQITAAVPEPTSVAMLGMGLIASAGFAARKARRNRN